MYNFVPGEQVVCVDDSQRPFGVPHLLVKGKIYTIKSNIGPGDDGEDIIDLEECPYEGKGTVFLVGDRFMTFSGYRESRFRRVVKKKDGANNSAKEWIAHWKKFAKEEEMI